MDTSSKKSRIRQPGPRRPDRRVERTRRALHAALVSLILEKGYDAVSVEEVADAADVGRSTFYAHFSDKEDLLRSGFERFREELFDDARKSSEPDGGVALPLAFSRALFEHAHDNIELYRAMVGGRGGQVATEQMKRLISDLIRDDLKKPNDGDASGSEFAVQFLAGAMLSVLQHWVGRKSQLTPAQVEDQFRRLASGALS